MHHACNRITNRAPGDSGSATLHLNGDFTTASGRDQVDAQIARCWRNVNDEALGPQQSLQITLKFNSAHAVNPGDPDSPELSAPLA